MLRLLYTISLLSIFLFPLYGNASSYYCKSEFKDKEVNWPDLTFNKQAKTISFSKPLCYEHNKKTYCTPKKKYNLYLGYYWHGTHWWKGYVKYKEFGIIFNSIPGAYIGSEKIAIETGKKVSPVMRIYGASDHMTYYSCKKISINSPIKNHFNKIKKEIRKSIQSYLFHSGFYDSKIDGLYGPNTKAAIESYAKSLGKEDHLKSEELAKELLQSLIFTSEDHDTDKSKTKKGLF